jgi:tRNA(Ile)-lysidine synthetase-like protein
VLCSTSWTDTCPIKQLWMRSRTKPRGSYWTMTVTMYHHRRAPTTMPLLCVVCPICGPCPCKSFASCRCGTSPRYNPSRTRCRTALLASFRKATHRRLAVLQDEVRRTGHVANGANATVPTPDRGSENNSQATATTTQPTESFSPHDILECGPFRADWTAASNHAVYQTIQTFLATVGIHPATATTTTDLARQTRRPIVISLSGGVDSMVIAAVLAQMQRNGGYPHLHLVAAHIDYANRPESSAEADYVQHYCREYWSGTLHYVCRRIDQVTRGVTARDEYERIAREIRFAFYRDTVQSCLAHVAAAWVQDRNDPAAPGLAASDVGVVLGHHRGDLRENVLSNAHKGCGPLDLSGMTATSSNDGVTLYRPLLTLEKTAIFDFAHTYGVPYFKDTTPHWSTRGKLRHKLLPLLEEIYGEGSMNNLSNLAVASDECRALMHKLMIQPFMDRIVYQPMGISLPTDPWKDQGLFFWNLVLRETLHSAGLGMFTDKSLQCQDPSRVAAMSQRLCRVPAVRRSRVCSLSR